MYVHTSHKYSFIVHMRHVCRYALAASTVIYFIFAFLPLIHMYTHRHTYTAWGHRGGLLLVGHPLRMAADEKYSSVSQSGLKEILFGLVSLCPFSVGLSVILCFWSFYFGLPYNLSSFCHLTSPLSLGDFTVTLSIWHELQTSRSVTLCDHSS